MMIAKPRRKFAGLALTAAVALAAIGGAALANQSNTWSPTTGTVSGLQVTTNYNNAFSAIQSCNSGAAAPANDQTAAAVKGQCWLNTSTTPNTVEMYDGTSWTTIGWLDTVAHQWIANNAGGTGTIASAATTDLGTVQNPVLSITGTTTITSFGTTAPTGATKFINFTGALTLTHNATTLILPNGGANITTAAGDTAIATALGGGNWRVLSYTRASGLAANSILASMLATSAVPYGTPCLNCTLNASVATNALTVAVKTLAGTDPTPSDPAYFLIPNGTGGYAVIEQTAALSITAPSGASLGTVNAQANRIWTSVFDNAGTPVLCVYNSLSGTNILPWDETGAPNGTAITAASTSAQTWYCANALTAKNFRVLGYVESTQATAGTWATIPSKVQLFGPGVKRPGEVVQTQTSVINAASTTTSGTFVALASQNISITPLSAANPISVRSFGAINMSTGWTGHLQLSRGTVAATNLFGVEAILSIQSGGSDTVPATVAGMDTPNTASSVTYAVQGKITGGAATLTYSQGQTFMEVSEIQI